MLHNLHDKNYVTLNILITVIIMNIYSYIEIQISECNIRLVMIILIKLIGRYNHCCFYETEMIENGNL